MTCKFVKMPIPGQPVKNDNCLFYSGEILCGEPRGKVNIVIFYLWKDIIKMLTL